jgi:MtN3 and saliva related transmembrane protein
VTERWRSLERASLERIKEAHWERVGLAMGLLACASIASQLVHELSSRTPSSLSRPFLVGFALVYAFWFLYGLRFRREAIWLSNGVAVVLQLLLTAVAVLKG